MEVERAKQRLLALLDEQDGSLTAAVVEADSHLAADRAITSAAAHALATESGIITGTETDSREWFPLQLHDRTSSGSPRRGVGCANSILAADELISEARSEFLHPARLPQSQNRVNAL